MWIKHGPQMTLNVKIHTSLHRDAAKWTRTDGNNDFDVGRPTISRSRIAICRPSFTAFLHVPRGRCATTTPALKRNWPPQKNKELSTKNDPWEPKTIHHKTTSPAPTTLL
jgi:hypothetical protein